ncbi:MAG: hypothetical protein ABF651_04385 [Sporolactobacillus sp.]
MEIYSLQTFLPMSSGQQTSNGNQATNRSVQSINIDPSSVLIESWSPGDSTQPDQLELYNKKGIKQVYYLKQMNEQPEYYSVLEEGLDQQEVSGNSLAGKETAEEQPDAMQNADLPTPIADSMNFNLFASSSSGNLTILSGAGASSMNWNLTNDDPDFLAEAVVSYHKAQAQITQTYSDRAIAQRASAVGITDVAAYQKSQDQIRDAELSAAEQNFEKGVESEIGAYVGDLYQFFDPSQNKNGELTSDGFSENPVYQQSEDDMADLAVELNQLYEQYEQTHAVDYSTDSVDTIAAQFNAVVLNQAQTTVNISGTDFTYKDLYVSHSALQAIGNEDQSLSDPFSAALGQSGINYLAQNEMTPGAAAMLKEGYATSYNQAITQLNDLVYGEDQPSSPDQAFQMLGSLNTSSAATFSSSFNQALSQLEDEYAVLGGGNQMEINHSNVAQETTDNLQNLYNAFLSLFEEAS